MLKILVDVREPEVLFQRLARNTSPDDINAFLVGAAREFLQQRVDNRFANEGDDAVGGAWAQLRRNTAGIRMAQGYGPYHPINRRTGKLYDFVRNTYRLRTQPASSVLTMPGKAPDKTTEDKFRVAMKGGASSKPAPTLWGVVGPTPNVPAVPRPVIGLSATDLTGISHLLAAQVFRP